MRKITLAELAAAIRQALAEGRLAAQHGKGKHLRDPDTRCRCAIGTVLTDEELDQIEQNFTDEEPGPIEEAGFVGWENMALAERLMDLHDHWAEQEAKALAGLPYDPARKAAFFALLEALP